MHYRRHLDPELLAQYVERGAPVMDTAALRHLQCCSSCAEDYVSLCLKSTVRKATAPESIWPAVESKIQVSKPDRARERGLPWGRRFVFSAAAVCMVGVLMVSAVLLLLRQKAESATLDVGRYLADLEKTDAGPSKENLHRLFTEFRPYDRREALQQTKLRSEAGNYHLVEQRISPFPANTVELIYDSGRDVFTVLVAPRTATLNFGNYHLIGADLSGVRCLRVQCPRQDVYWLTTGARQYVFVRRHDSFGDSEQLFRTLIQEAP
jgi:hypothetical protein